MAPAETSRLSAELDFYALHKALWLKDHPGQFVVIRGNRVLDFYSNFEAAYQAGAYEWGLNTDFLVKQIIEHEPVFFVF